MFGFGEKKETEQRKVKWIAPTTGTVYYEDEELPHLSATPGGGTIYIDEGTFDDWLDLNAPERVKRDKQDSQSIEEMKKMMTTLLRRQEELEQMVASLIRRQYDREQQEKRPENNEETEYQR